MNKRSPNGYQYDAILYASKNQFIVGGKRLLMFVFDTGLCGYENRICRGGAALLPNLNTQGLHV